MLLLILVLVSVVASEWDCKYKPGFQYNYNFTSTLLNGVPGKQADNENTRGVSVSGDVMLVPLRKGELQPFYVQLSITGVLEYSVLSPFAPAIDQTIVYAVFYPGTSKVFLPRGQNVHGSNILRGIVTTLKINSCTQTGQYSVQETTIVGTHNTTYTNNGRGRRDGGRDIAREIGEVQELPRPVGSTSAKHKQFIQSLLQSSSKSLYMYLVKDGVVNSAVLSEKINPVHAVGYSSSSDLSIRTSLTLWSSLVDSLGVSSMSVSTLNTENFAGTLVEGDLRMDYSVPNLAPVDNEFPATVQHLQTMLNAGYIRTSPQVIRPWLDIVRYLQVGVQSKVYRAAFERADDSYSLPWLIDAANVNGTAQLHLAIHNAIRLSRAYELTERLISSKQFTPNPSTRMIKWLMKTCSIDRYREVCSLALSTSATNYLYYNEKRANSVAVQIYEFLKGRIMSAKTDKEKVFFLRTLGNIKTEKASQLLIDLIHTLPNPDHRQVSLQSLTLHPSHYTSANNRSMLLSDLLARNDKSGASALFWVMVTSSLEELPRYIRLSVSTMCPSHPLSFFLHDTLTLLQDTRSNPQRAAVVRSEVSKLYAQCQYCLQSSSTLQSEKVLNDFVFGSSVQGVEVLFQRYSTSNNEVHSGTTSLVLHYLKAFGVNPMILQTSFTLGALDIFSRGYTTGDLLVVVAGEQVKIPTFQLNGDANVDINVLLIDTTQLVPTLSGLPVSYSLAGNVRTETRLDCAQYPTITVTNKIGLFISAMFRLDGVPMGYNTLATMSMVYDNVHKVIENQLTRHSSVKDLSFKIDTSLPGSWSNTKDNVEFYQEFTILNSTLALSASSLPQRSASGCNVKPALPTIDFGLYAETLSSHSYVSLWLDQNSLLNLQNATIYEMADWQCNDLSPLKDLVITDPLPTATLYTVDIEVLNGILLVSSHNRVSMYGDSGERNTKLTGTLTDIVEVLRTSKYYALDSYNGPELMTLSLHSAKSTVTSRVVFSASDPCIEHIF